MGQYSALRNPSNPWGARSAYGLGEESLPGTVVFKAKDVSGASHTVTCDVANAFARLPVAMTKPGENIYHCVENMCRCTYEEQGATGLANVEIGKLFSSSGEPLPSQNSEMRIAQREP